jgi:hypothetical protein
MHAEDRHVLFIWQEVQPHERLYWHGQFAVHFGFWTKPQYGAFDLAWMLLHFTDVYSHLIPDMIRPVRVSYLITPTLVVGIPPPDDSIQPIFNMISGRGFSALQLSYPVSMWPDTARERQCLANIHRVCLIFRLTAYVFILLSV